MGKRIKLLVDRLKWMIVPKEYKQQIDDLRGLYFDEQERADDLMYEAEILKAERDEAEYMLEVEREDFEHRLDMEISELESELDELRDDYEYKLDTLQDDYDDLEHELDLISGERDDLEYKLDTLQVEFDDYVEENNMNEGV